ncbi:MAG: LPS export ABC transporter periplasmic protein LptC [Candidatus Velthaea sp.]|jgi:LPS export ABC transporter protein LptC
MLRKILVGLGVSALTACGGPASNATSTPAPSAIAPRPETSTPEPVHIETNSSGDKYITVVQRVKTGAPNGTRIAYQLRALSSQADIVGSQSIVTFERPHITFLDHQGKTLIADSPQAKITQQDKSVLMSGGVHARAADGSVLTCDTLRYDGRTEKLHGEGHVVLSGPNDLTLTGNYLEGDVRLDDVRVAEHSL